MNYLRIRGKFIGNGIHEELVRNLWGIRRDLLGICTEVIGSERESHGERSERASAASERAERLTFSDDADVVPN